MHDPNLNCRSIEDIANLAGRRVSVVGEYVQLDPRQKPKPPPQFDGHAAVRLQDGTLVMLEPGWSPAAIRSADERERLSGAQVAAVGVLWLEAPAPPEPVAFEIGPCLSPVECVEPA